MSEIRLNVRIDGVLADYVQSTLEQGLYNSQSELVRALIRNAMEDPRRADIVRPGLAPEELARRKQGLREAVAMQKMESNPLTEDEIAMFEMFDREGWSDEQCHAYITEKVKNGEFSK